MFLSEWREFPSAPYLEGKEKIDDSSLLNVVEIARSLTCFRGCFLSGGAKELSAPRYEYCSKAGIIWRALLLHLQKNQSWLTSRFLDTNCFKVMTLWKDDKITGAMCAVGVMAVAVWTVPFYLHVL